jgi:DNA-directed RNA polymerase specialized sigma24 family protein
MAMSNVRRTAEPKSIEVFERLLAGESPDEVATSLGMKRDAVHKVKQRMRNRLRDLVAEQILDEDGAEDE